MKTKTFPSIVKKVHDSLGRDSVLMHKPTAENQIGQSGAHTFANDVIDIVMNSPNEAEAYKRLITFLADGQVEF